LHRTPEEHLRLEDREIELFGENKPATEAYYYIIDKVTMKRVLRDEDLGLAFGVVFQFLLEHELS